MVGRRPPKAVLPHPTTKAMAVEPDFSALSVQSTDSQESGAEQTETDGRAPTGVVPAPQKAAEITMENKKTAQARKEEGRRGGHAIGGYRRELNPPLADFASRSTGGRGDTGRSTNDANRTNVG